MLNSQTDEQGSLTYLTSVERARFRRPVVPGDQLVLEVEWSGCARAFKLRGRRVGRRSGSHRGDDHHRLVKKG